MKVSRPNWIFKHFFSNQNFKQRNNNSRLWKIKIISCTEIIAKIRSKINVVLK